MVVVGFVPHLDRLIVMVTLSVEIENPGKTISPGFTWKTVVKTV